MIDINTVESSLFDFECYQNEEIFFWDKKRVDEFQKKYILDIFKHHYTNCHSYRRYCDFHKVDPDKLTNFMDLDCIPLIPTVIFKNMDVLSVDSNKIVKKCLSSGTLGQVSSVFRDEITIDRLLCSISVSLKDLYDYDQDKFITVNLGPDTDEAGDVWFTYITSIVDLISKTYYFIKNERLLNDKLFKFLSEYNGQKDLLLLGPPVMFKYFCEYLMENNLKIKLKENDILITAGGWKKHSGEKIDRETLEDMVVEYLGIKKENVFDAFNQVELNTVICECKSKRKHIPPWVKVIVRDPITLRNVGENVEGILSFIDLSSNSYPCFILTEDIGKVSSGCECGRPGYFLEIIRRVNKVESKGCAIKLDSKILK